MLDSFCQASLKLKSIDSVNSTNYKHMQQLPVTHTLMLKLLDLKKTSGSDGGARDLYQG